MDDYPRAHVSNVLLSGWHIADPWGFTGFVIYASLLARIVMVFLRCIEGSKEFPPPASLYWSSLKGKVPPFEWREKSDYMFPALLGTSELFAYPGLMAIGQFTAISAWIGLKTVVQ